MRKSIFLFSAISFLFTISVLGQDISESEVPTVVKNKFLAEYPEATELEWEMEENLYKVVFELEEDTENKVWCNVKGEIVKREEEITEKDLPTLVLCKIQTEFKKHRIDEVDKVMTATEVYYEVELNSFWRKNWEVTIDSNGEILNKVVD